MATAIYPYVQYSGIWNLSSQANAKGAGTWPSPPAYKLYTWGSNNSGKGGLNLDPAVTYSWSSPRQVGSLTDWVSIASSPNAGHVVSNRADGTLWTWGYNAYGQLGLGNTTNYSSPKQVGALTNWASVGAGYLFSLAIKNDGTLWSWGRGNTGQLGLGNTSNFNSPKQVGLLTNWLKVVGGNYYTAAIKTDGTLWMWGSNNGGQLGLGNTTYYSSPKQVGILTNWSSVSCSENNIVLALKTDGSFWGWGNNGQGQIGLGNTTFYSSPKQIGALTNWTSNFVSGFITSGAIKTDGSLWTWGYNGNGQLGLGNITNYSSPKQVGSLTTWLKISAGYRNTYAIKTDGTLWSWGNNAYGSLGINSNTEYSSPKQVGSGTNWFVLSNQGNTFGMAAITNS